jgi:hypothetical protein
MLVQPECMDWRRETAQWQTMDHRAIHFAEQARPTVLRFKPLALEMLAKREWMNNAVKQPIRTMGQLNKSNR